ncbi:sulfite exporter TauE/SafE family protein [Sphingomonas changnyeongensis]|uniref:sulfite exporter TauE/SafE family protein n=1 Tax=Sphingomonas changnyeongensis TaxID=2698679 RepID=UPI00191BEE42|nr:sulfite exporter TauE/SafE family protein [Sphingomonas changnyeongensis]
MTPAGAFGIGSGGGFALLALAGFIAGGINALAGGGSLVSFPALIAVGLPPLAANVTSSVALLPGYLGGVIGERADLAGQGGRLIRLAPLALLGGLAGGALALAGGERRFAALAPWLLIAGCLLLAGQPWLKRWLTRRSIAGTRPAAGALALGAAVFAACIYGGYFGAGLSVMLLALLALGINDNLVRLNALKQGLALAANLGAVLLFLAAAPLDRAAAGVMAVAALAGAWRAAGWRDGSIPTGCALWSSRSA